MTTGCGAALQLDASSAPLTVADDRLDREGEEGCSLSLPLSLSSEQNINHNSMTTTSVFNIRTQYRGLGIQQ